MKQVRYKINVYEFEKGDLGHIYNLNESATEPAIVICRRCEPRGFSVRAFLKTADNAPLKDFYFPTNDIGKKRGFKTDRIVKKYVHFLLKNGCFDFDGPTAEELENDFKSKG